jgi:hypothetical protein
MINLNTTVFFFTLIFSRLRGISTTWSLSPLHFEFHKEVRSKGEKQHTQIHSKMRTHTAKNRAQKGYLKVLTRTELESLRMTDECAKTECG